MDLATIIGIGLAVFSLLISIFIEGGSLGSLINVSAGILVLGGTFGATMVCFPISAVKQMPRWLAVALKDRKTDIHEDIAIIVTLAETARREGILKLENMVEDLENAYLKQGVNLVVDGTDYEVTKAIMKTELELMEERHSLGAKFFETAGGFAPTMGIIGTVMGLVNVLGHLSDSGNLGGAIATAFIATFYGISTANILWLPIAAKLKSRSNDESLAREMIMEGVLSIQAGESPRIIGDRLKSFLPPDERQKSVGHEVHA